MISAAVIIDQLADFLLKQGIRNFQLEFGTDAISYGKSQRNNDQTLIVIQPEGSKEVKSFIKEIKLKNKAYSSSGNFEKFYMDEQG